MFNKISDSRPVNHIKKTIIGRVIKKLIFSKLEEIPFIIFFTFLLTFLFTRFFIHFGSLNRIQEIIPVRGIFINGIHIHHLNFGIIILAVVGFVSLYDIKPLTHRKLSALYGIGLALTFDEFALWLKLENDYHARITYDAVITITLILLNFAYLPGFWNRMGKKILRLSHHFISLARQKVKPVIHNP